MRKGVVLELKGQDENGNADAAVVAPIEERALRCTAVLPWWLRGKAGDLSEGVEVVFERFIDGTAFAVARADGYFGGVIYGDVKIGADSGTQPVSLADKVKANSDKIAQAVQAIAAHTHAVEGTAAAADPSLAPYAAFQLADTGADKVEAT